MKKSELKLLLKEIAKQVLCEGISPKATQTITNWMTQYGSRSTAIKIVDNVFKKLVGIDRLDMPDSATFANGLDEIETQLTSGDFEGAIQTAKETVKSMMGEEDAPEDMFQEDYPNPIGNNLPEDDKDEPAGYDDLANVVANNEQLLKLMGKHGLTELDLNNDTRGFYEFIIKYLKVIQKVGRFAYVKNPQDLEVDWYYANKDNSKPMKENEMSAQHLINGQSNIVAAKKVNTILHSASQGIFSDNSWEAINNIFKKLKEVGLDVTIMSAKYGGHADTSNGLPKYKEWIISIPFTNKVGKQMELVGPITAHGAGSMEQPLDRYDITAYVSARPFKEQ